MEQKTFYSNLQPSEMAIFSVAGNIYASYISSGRVTEQTETEMIKKSIEASIKIANIVEKTVQSDNEVK